MRKIFPHICLIFCVLFLTHINLAQDKSEKDKQKPEPTLFDTYSETSDHSESLLTAYTERFANTLKEAPNTTKGVFIVYSGSGENMCSKDRRFVEKKFKFLQTILMDRHKISTDRVSSMFSLWRECNEVEFWLVPKDAKLPTATPTLIMDYQCGDLSISGIEKADSKTQYIYFYAFVSGADEIEYKWTVSAGKIVEGQGSTRIKVDISSVTAQEVKATIEAQDKCSEVCNLKDSFTTKIIP